MERLAHYELLSKIATGGMAEIWVARDDSARDAASRICVIKKLLPQHADNEEFIRMFLDEGRIGATFDHPNVVRMFDFGSASGTHFLAMEYLHGEDLRVVNRINRAEGKAIPLAQAIHIITRACAGLHHAHEARNKDGAPLEIVHRDVSPHNVLLTFDGGVKVVDFGIAKSLERRWETKHGILKGKVPYMSPEQIKARRLDRRTDVYAMGVMLYELIVGRRPYVLSAAGDFAMMMAIARHDVRPPREVQPDVDPELEAIIERAMTYDPKGRYPTMLELQNALEKFAEKRDLELGSDALARYLEKLFGEKVDAWRTAQEREDLAKHIVQVEEERAQSGLYDEDSDGSATYIVDEISSVSSTTSRPGATPGKGQPPQSAASLVVSTSSAIASVVELFGVTVVTLRGRIDESFDGAALGGSLSGTVLIDMKNVERVTSFGVREWLEMSKAIDEEDDTSVWLARCPEAVVTQMSLIRTFVGKAKLLSFQAPFLCDDCGASFSRVLDCEHDAPWFREGKGPLPHCPRCNGQAKLDDDPGFLAFATPFAGLAVPERIREILETIEASDGSTPSDVVDKVVTQEETRVRVHRDVDRSVRWNRILDGIEGRLVVDFHGVPRVSADGAANFARAMKALGPEVTSAEIVECPLSVLAALGQRGESTRPRVVSVAFEGRCHACAAARTGVVAMSEVTAAATASRSPFVPCRRCNAGLDVKESFGMLATAFAPPSSPTLSYSTPASAQVIATLPTPIDPAPPSIPGSGSVGAIAARVAPSSGRSSLHAWVGLAVAGIAAVGLFAFAAIRMHAPVSAAADATLASSSPVTSSSTPDSIVLAHDEVAIMVTVVSEGGPNGSVDDLAHARTRAVELVVQQIEAALPDEVRRANAAAPLARSAAATEERFTRDVGSFASPDRVAVHVDTEAKPARLSARYRLERSAFDRATKHYATTRAAYGMTFAPALPTRHDGLVVVSVDPSAKPAAGIAPGAVLVMLDDRAAVGVDTLSGAKLGSTQHNASFLSANGSTLSAKLK